MSAIANVRSPLFINPALPSSGNYVRAEYEVRIWTGTSITDKPATPTYTMTKYNTSGDNQFPLEISELVRDYINTDYYTDVVNDAVWVRYDADYYRDTDPDGSPSSTGGKTWLAFDGYGYFDEGVNPREQVSPVYDSYTPQLLQDNTTVYFIKGEDIKIPIFAESLATITYKTGGSTSFWNAVDDFWDTYDVSWADTASIITITDDGNSNQKIQYVNITGTENLQDGDIIKIENGIFGYTTTITLKEICELKYVPYRVVFYNKYGVLQDLWFNKKSVETINVTSSNYKRNIIEFASTVPTAYYNTNKHANRRFDVVANETIQLSTGYVVEALNEPIKQLLMSESVWVDDGTNVYPVNVDTNSLQMKKSVNEKLIAYTLDFSFAFDKIQNVR
jgi:hypothetical protein